MIRVPLDFDPDAPIVVIDIGNTAITLATWQKGQIKTPLSVPKDDQATLEEAFAAHGEACPKGRPAAVVVGSVVPQVLARIRAFVDRQLDQEALVVGETVPLPMEVGVTDARAIGVDRVCAAAAAYDKLQAACTIVDFGTAVTVDLVDAEGVLLGGAILPGLALQLRALHEYTAVLPEVAAGIPQLPYGRNTVEAMQTGVCRGLAGAVRALVEGYAAMLNRWPQVLATGGDLELLAPQCDFLDTLVPHLTLQGIGLAYRKHLADAGV